MNRRTFGLRSMASLAAAIGLTAASVSISEAATFPDGLCDDWQAQGYVNRWECANRECRRESSELRRARTPGVFKRYWELWGFSTARACADAGAQE